MHTPGPWTYEPKSGWINADNCCTRGPMHVADIRGWGHLTGHGHGAHAMSWDDAKVVQDGNGKLICGVHDLLEAALAAKNYIEELRAQGHIQGGDYTLSKLEAAITKSTF